MLSLMAAVSFVAAVQLRAGDAPAPAVNPFFGSLSAVSAAELPAKSAELISKADTKTQRETAVNVVKAAVGLNPAAAAAIVGSIAQSTPKMAPVVAATAAALVPNQVVAIARAAAAAAPSEAGKIVEAVCRVVPTEYKAVASSVAGVAPGEDKTILAGISAAIPALQEPIAKVLSGNDSVNPLSDVLPHLPSLPSDLPISAPQSGPPFVVIPTSPVNLDPGNGTAVPPGGRKYDLP